MHAFHDRDASATHRPPFLVRDPSWRTVVVSHSPFAPAGRHRVNREAFKLFLKDGPQRGRYTYWVVVTVVLPVCVKRVRGFSAPGRAPSIDTEHASIWLVQGWFWLKGGYHHGPYAPVLEYAFFSAGDALLVPLMVRFSLVLSFIGERYA